MQKTIETLSDEEIALFIGFFYRPVLSVTRENLITRDRLICLLMLDAGLRVGEVIDLTMGHLHLGGEPVNSIELSTRFAEKGSTRIIPITVRLRDAISLMYHNVWFPKDCGPTSRAFFGSDVHECLTTRQVERMTRGIGRSTISRDVNPHMLRHTFATRLMKVTNIRVVQQLLGHSSLQSTQIYTHPNTSDLQTAIARLK